MDNDIHAIRPNVTDMDMLPPQTSHIPHNEPSDPLNTPNVPNYYTSMFQQHKYIIILFAIIVVLLIILIVWNCFKQSDQKQSDKRPPGARGPGPSMGPGPANPVEGGNMTDAQQARYHQIRESAEIDRLRKQQALEYQARLQDQYITHPNPINSQNSPNLINTLNSPSAVNPTKASNKASKSPKKQKQQKPSEEDLERDLDEKLLALNDKKISKQALINEDENEDDNITRDYRTKSHKELINDITTEQLQLELIDESNEDDNHCEDTVEPEIPESTDNNKCMYIQKSGKKRGQSCNKECIGDRCTMHKNK